MIEDEKRSVMKVMMNDTLFMMVLLIDIVILI